MGDLDPTARAAQFAPRNTNLVDAVAETRRIADQIMRSNPLKDAKIDSGLTEWRGNYGGSLVWIGEITPVDQNLFDPYGNLKKQRALVVQRDDPGQQFAITMYDGNPQAGVPLRQTLTISDGTGHRIMQESFLQLGRRFPDKAIPMYSKQSIDTGLNFGTDTIVWSGSGNIIGTHMNFDVEWTGDGTVTQVSSFIRFSGGGVTIDTATVLGGANNAYGGTTDITTIFNASDFIDVQWHIWRSGGTGLYRPRMNRMRNFSNT
jgi:hypothetical protein